MSSPVDVVLAQSLEHALELLGPGDPRIRPVSGATDALLRLHLGRLSADRLVSVFDLAELRGIQSEPGGLRVGAATPLWALQRHPAVRAHFPAALEALHQFASPQIRQRATLGGNIGNASPAADMVAPLLALGAELTVRSRQRGPRALPLDSVFLGFGRTALLPDELITDVFLPFQRPGHQSFAKFGSRNANVISVVNVALTLTLDGNTITQARAAYGSVAPKPLRASTVESFLQGQTLSTRLVDEVADAVRAQIAPIDDVRGSRRYKERLAIHATQEALRRALAPGDAR